VTGAGVERATDAEEEGAGEDDEDADRPAGRAEEARPDEPEQECRAEECGNPELNTPELTAGEPARR
jgi:hypothetical protein